MGRRNRHLSRLEGRSQRVLHPYQAVLTFITDYVLANLKGITQHQVWNFLQRPGVTFRLLIGTACCFSTIAVVFVSRRAEIMKANASREWFISYVPIDPRHA